jgi:hypothetical protein
MLKSGTINQAMHVAARAFKANFATANLDPIRAAPILRVPGIGRDPDLTERRLGARRRVHTAMQALGGINSPAGCVWNFVGHSEASESGRCGSAGVVGLSNRRPTAS